MPFVEPDRLNLLEGYEQALMEIRDQINSLDAARQGAPSTLDNITSTLEEIGVL